MSQRLLPVSDYDLGATLACGQAFRWKSAANGWVGVIGNRWVRLAEQPKGLLATVAEPTTDWDWLEDYLQTRLDFDAVLRSFPNDAPLRAAVTACHGLRLLKQEPWECLASFICSSTKRIVQIQQIVENLCECFGAPVTVPVGHAPAYSFPSPERIAAAGEAELRACKMGFRAPNLLRTAVLVANGAVDLQALRLLPVEQAREELIQLPGVGRKIADCVLLFAYGFQEAFPVDVWVRKALRQLYFPKRRPSAARLLKFSQTHFGPYAGYAQQYLFHYMRTVRPRSTERSP